MATTNAPARLLEVRELSVRLQGQSGPVTVLDEISFGIEPGQTLGIVGESGAGKSMLGRALLGLIPAGAVTERRGEIVFEGRDLASMTEAQLRSIRGSTIALIPQDSLRSLNPVRTIGRQLAEPLQRHLGMGRTAARRRSIELLRLVEIPAADRRIDQFPHELSGGMRQRVSIAIAIACEPALVIADEPTTALDVTVQAQILDLLGQVQERVGMAMILITHDFDVVGRIADRVAVMYAGQVVESGPVADVLTTPRMRYTRALLDSIPRVTAPIRVLLPIIPGQPPNVGDDVAGCRFNARCAFADDNCRIVQPPVEWSDAQHAHEFRCWHPVPVSPEIRVAEVGV